jgi:hypothetical protein
MPPKPKYGITKDLLEDLHLNQRRTPKEIASQLGCHHSLVLWYIKKYDIPKLPKYERLEGKRFGRLVVVSFAGIKGRSAVWDCQCDCGNLAKATTANLNFGKVKSCGCLSTTASKKHHWVASRPYIIWQGMKTRCDNPKSIGYHRYGGRGITYDPRWKEFSVFWEDMGENYRDDLTIERKDNNAGYSKGNCVWIDYRRQNFNKCTNVFLVYDGRTQTATEWALELGVNRRTIYYLHDRGLCDAEIFDKIL